MLKSKELNPYKIESPKKSKRVKKPTQIFRYLNAEQNRKDLAESVSKMNARLRTLKSAEEKNISKAKLMESVSRKIIYNKELKFKSCLIMNGRMEDLKKSQRCLEKNVSQLASTTGPKHFGDQQRAKRIEDKQLYQQRVQVQYQETVWSVREENQQIHNRLFEQEQLRKQNLINYRNDRISKSRQNYEQRIQTQFLQAEQERKKLELLEKREQEMLERLKITQLIKETSYAKLDDAKKKPFSELINIS